MKSSEAIVHLGKLTTIGGRVGLDLFLFCISLIMNFDWVNLKIWSFLIWMIRNCQGLSLDYVSNLWHFLTTLLPWWDKVTSPPPLRPIPQPLIAHMRYPTTPKSKGLYSFQELANNKFFINDQTLTFTNIYVRNRQIFIYFISLKSCNWNGP